MNLLTTSLIIVGAGLLAASLVPVSRLITQLPKGGVRNAWYLLTALILVFMLGYIGYTIDRWDKVVESFDLIVTVIFLFGACFVLLVNNLSLRTALDVRRIAVLEHENVTDPLMGIFNRRYLERRLNEELARAGRYNQPLSLLLLDVDKFKQINDLRGHATADLALVNLGKLIANTVRAVDIVARYGGDEILVIAPSISTESAGRLAERLRQAVSDTNLAASSDGANSEVLRVTVSVGVTGLGSGIKNAESLLACADHALYQAKREGRDRVIIHEE